MDEFYGATHYSVQQDGVSMQMLYKKATVKLNNGTEQLRWFYLSYANLWQGSGDSPEFFSTLLPIDQYKIRSLIAGIYI